MNRGGDLRSGRADALIEPADLADQIIGQRIQGGQQRGLGADRAQQVSCGLGAEALRCASRNLLTVTAHAGAMMGKIDPQTARRLQGVLASMGAAAQRCLIEVVKDTARRLAS
jgi:hypothetical protein